VDRDLITLTQARTVITESRALALIRSLTESIDTWQESMRRPGLDETTRARAISNLFYFNTAGSLANDGGARHGEYRNQRYIAFDDRLAVRCKLLDRNLESSNFPTDQAEDWLRQRQLEGFPPFDRLTLGYRLDLTGLRMRDLFITLPTGVPGFFNQWVWQVWGTPLDMSVYGTQLRLRESDVGPGETFFYEDYSLKTG
jgi:hypothetical protein